MTSGKWSDDTFLDLLKGHKDDLADLAVSRLIEDHGIQKVGYIFKQMSANDDQVPADAPRALRDFVEQTRDLPPGIDHERLAQHEALLPFGPISCLIMLAASLPHGYSAPRLSRILTISDDLARHPYKRLMGVVQLLINLGSRDAFVPGGRAVVTAQKMRLLSAPTRRATTSPATGPAGASTRGCPRRPSRRRGTRCAPPGAACGSTGIWHRERASSPSRRDRRPTRASPS